jgi:TonB family protein
MLDCSGGRFRAGRLRAVFSVAIVFTVWPSITGRASTGQAPKTVTPPTRALTLPTYPESADGLKQLIAAVFATLQAGDTEKANLYFKSMAIPNDEDWFATVFGADQGAQLDTKYKELLPELAAEVEQNLGAALSEARTDVTVGVFQKPLDDNVRGLERAVVEAMVNPVRLYTASSNNSSRARSVTLGQFFYVRGGFRYADNRVLTALSTAPPPRMNVASMAQQAKLIHKIDPIYPDEAKATKLAGVVTLRAIVGEDGAVKEIKVIRGDPVLSRAALDAARLWLYEPTLVNGRAVEVETTINVVFRPPTDGQ